MITINTGVCHCQASKKSIGEKRICGPPPQSLVSHVSLDYEYIHMIVFTFYVILQM